MTRYQAFLSHNGADKPSVEELARLLERRGISCWLDKWNLIPGDPWQPALEEALSNCGTCVVFFGPSGVGPWHNEEMRLAIQRRVAAPESRLRVLPVILPGGERAKESEGPGFLQAMTWVKFEKSIDDEDALYRLECGIRGIPPGPRGGIAIPEGECPYLGLKTFQPENAGLFFGRRAKIQELIDRLKNGFGSAKEERFLALIGASGSGKSSLALAGLIPAIQGGELPESRAWLLARCRPGARPWESLQVALAANQQIAPHLPALPALIIGPEDEERRLHLTARLALHDAPEACRLFILIDQFEEVFTLCKEEAARRQLIDNLLYSTSIAEGRTVVVLTMRADFYGQCAEHAGLRAAISDHQSLIGPLSEEELREVIETPGQIAGGELEPGLMELLLSDMEGQAGALPFLEDALFRLWERRDGRRLTAKAYIEMGRLGGALDAHAEEFFNGLTPDEQALCHQVFLDLVHPGEGAADTKKRVAIDDVASTETARVVLKKLADARLITTTGEREHGQAELAHEAMITGWGWKRLRNWVNENREKSRLKERLLDSAQEWQESGKGADFLYRGAQLGAAEEAFGSTVQALPKSAREFLEASITERNREQRQRLRRILAVAGSVVIIVASVATAVVWESTRKVKRAEEDRKREEEVSRRFAQQGSRSDFLLASLYAKDDPHRALAHLSRALKSDPENHAAERLGWSLASIPGSLAILPHEAAVTSASFSAHGTRVVSASDDGTARVWDARSGEPLAGPLKHEGSVTSASFSADGTRVVTASWDKTARVWDARSGEPLTAPLKHEGLVTSANFSADGTRVVTASWDETARIWDIAFDQSSTPAWASGLFDQIAGQHLDDKTGFPAMITRIDRKFNFQDPKETRAMFAKWLTADRSTRTISPLSSETIPQYIERRLEIDSEKAIKEAFIADPSQPLVLIAQAKFERDPERADFLRRYAIDRFGEQPATTWERAAEMLQKQKQLELALRCADQAIKLDPNLGAGHWRRSDLLWAQQKWDASFAASGEAIRLEPKKVDWLQERGYRYAQRGMADQAIVEFEKALGVAAEPKSRLNVVRGYGWALIDLEKPAEANEKFHSAATISPDPDKYSGLQAGLALSAWLMGNKDESIAAFVRLCALDQDYAKGPFIRQRDWSDKKISALQQIRAAAIAAHPELAPKPDSESPQAPSTQP